ncbi:2-octaprenyl-6-methoxyphenyl hydroxylase [Shewanella sp. NFH-SH190041]|uniref:2-octaprenyl-6-methoxyphenyl hydroxylase n=1 Tax=Shewanella sp. NFH-SH190041 TaxID=2950245 RepID=UPI0021C2C6B8|nr:2-octaprenyl-6-methoxyphenyl hydroxylase [Shewanella sp. NFH-SH190041]BDM65466.1 2-octaprenyl-6-methoxyphenyl hydroxylase [Shewanella sp. NFH-SH190041]
MLQDKDCPCFDVVIIGGAMTGATLALMLAKLRQPTGRPLTVALVEASRPGDGHPGFDARAIALAQGSVNALNEHGLWSALKGNSAAIDSIHVSDRGHAGMTLLEAQRFSRQPFGCVIELAQAGNALTQMLDNTQVAYFCPVTLSQIEPQQSGHLLTLACGQRLFTRLLVAADGANSFVRQTLQLPLETYQFDQSAVIANVAVTDGVAGRAWERFTHHGPMALLPMAPEAGQSRLSLVWAMSRAEAQQAEQWQDADFLAALQQAFGYRAGRFIRTGQRHIYPLTMTVMPRPIYHRCIFIGNAAQTLHPIAGQGFNLGLRDVLALQQVIAQALATSSQGDVDIGEHAWLHRYLQERASDRQQTVCGIEWLVRGFSNDDWPLVVGRNLGLRLLAWLPPLQAPLVQRAMGWKRN